MALQLSVAARNALLDAIGRPSAPRRIWTSAPAPSRRTVRRRTRAPSLNMALPSDWMAAASGGTKAKSGTWSGTADAAGTAGHFRLKDTTDTTCHMQGSVIRDGWRRAAGAR